MRDNYRTMDMLFRERNTSPPFSTSPEPLGTGFSIIFLLNPETRMSSIEPYHFRMCDR